MDKAPAARGTQDITVVWIVFILFVVGLVLAYWFMLYKPKKEEIAMVQASIAAKTTTLEDYKKEAKELLNYEDQFAALVHQWNKNQHYFVNGLVWDEHTGTYKKPFKNREQWAIFNALLDVFQAGHFAGVAIKEMTVSEDVNFYMNDEPFEIPDELKGAVGWKPIFSDRGENQNPMFSSHNFSVIFYGNVKEIRRFIEVLQKLEGKVQKIFTVHCYETGDKPSYTRDVVGLGDIVLTKVTLEVKMFLSVYELNPDAKTANSPPDLPGSASCSYGSGGGGRGGGGGGGGGRGGGGGMGLGI